LFFGVGKGEKKGARVIGYWLQADVIDIAMSSKKPES
jgi:hypothetical protein